MRIAWVRAYTLSLVLAACGNDGEPPSQPDAGVPDSNLGCESNVDCDALDGPCAEGACVNGACQIQALVDGTSCDDGDACSTGDVCMSGACDGVAKDCSALADACHAGSCNTTTGECEEVPINDGGACDDGDACTTGEACSAGECTDGQARNCTELDGPCTVGVCEPQTGECQTEAAAEGESCDDGDACTSQDACAGGECAGSATVDCTSLDGPCSMGICNSADGTCMVEAINEGTACDDLDLCTDGDTCTSGECTGVPPDCSGFDDVCLQGVCQTETGACVQVPVNEGEACDDDDACTSGEVCAGGNCGALPATGIVFFEDFSDNSTGWTVGADWTIGPATTSTGHSADTFPDPGVDHSPGSNNGVAGVVIGGNAPKVPHPGHWLESPPIDLSELGGNVYLSYFRHLNSDWPPWMSSRVEVWDGSSWQTIFANSGVILDAEWTFQQHDVTAFKHAAFRVRFGYSVHRIDDLLTVSSWNLDDLSITSGPCDENGFCTSGIAANCAAFDGACLVGRCGPGGACEAEPLPQGTPCGGSCAAASCDGAGNCVGLPFPDGDPCLHAEQDACNIALCADGACTLYQVANGSACSSSGPCMAGACADGVCVESAVDDGSACPTGNECRIGTCLAGACEVTQASDDTACAGSGAACSVGRCSAGTCVDQAAENGTACSDDLACTDGDTCQDGACTGGPPTDCAAMANDCNIGLCDEVAGGCFREPANAGSGCDDGSSCTSGETCDGGACTFGTLGCICGPGETAVVVSAAGLPLTLDDFTTTGSVINVSDTGSVTRIVVQVSATHPFVEDLDLALIGPGGATLVLSSANGGDGDDYSRTVFDDDAAARIEDGQAPFAGAFAPEDSLAILLGEPVVGNWTLSVTDTTTDDIGTLTEFSIAFCLQP